VNDLAEMPDCSEMRRLHLAESGGIDEEVAVPAMLLNTKPRGNEEISSVCFQLS